MLRIKENEPSVCEKVFIKSGDNCHFVKLYFQGHVPYVSDNYQNRVNCFNKPLREKGANRVISGPHFSVFSPNTRKNGPEITSYSDTFHTIN